MDCPKTEHGEVAVACLPDDSVAQRSDMDCPKTESGEVAVACLPDDSVVDILSRLPAKPLFRFKCVSKDWCGLITDRLRCRKFPQTLEGFIGRKDYFGASILSERTVPLVDPCFSFLTELPEIENIILLDSCNGLVLFEHVRIVSDSDSDDGDRQHMDLLGYIVCNPATEEWVNVPSPGYTEGGCDWDRTYLIFDPTISPHFQLFHLRLYDLLFGWSHLVEVHTFSSVTGAWRQELEGAPRRTLVGVKGMGVCRFDGMLHVGALEIPSQNQPHLCSENKHMILAVGGEGRPFRTLHWPKKDRGVLVCTGQSQGQLLCLSGCMTEDSQMTELSIWVLEDYNAEKWVLRDNVSLTQLFKRTRCRFFDDWSVVGIHPDRGLVFFAEYWNHKLISYDMDKKEVHAICSLHGYRRPIIPYVPYFAKSAALAKKY